MITAERLREILDYNPETGLFTWKTLTRRCRRVNIGDVAGCISGRHARISIEGASYKSHRLAWLFYYGQWPNKRIDHINGNGCDNRIVNLREATQSENICNQKMRRDNTTGFKGVERKGSNFTARIKKESVRLFLGTFKTAEEAHAAYCEASRKLHGEYRRV